MEEFCAKLADTMEVEALKASDVLEDFEEWDSLTALTVIAMLGRDYRVHLSAAELKGAGTVAGLYELVSRKRGN